MYPFSDQLTTIPTYVDYFMRDISYLIMIYLMAKFIPGMSKELNIMFWLWLGYVIEYLLIYNEVITYVSLEKIYISLEIPVSYSLIAGLIMLGVTLKTIFKHDNT